MEFWSGNRLNTLKDNEIFVFGSNPEGRHGLGAAKAAMSFGAKYGIGRGLQGQTYAIITKNLKAGFTDKTTGINYPKQGVLSVSRDQIIEAIQELYDYALAHPEKRFLITYQHELVNGKPKKSLNGYDSKQMLDMFLCEEPPENIIFHDSYAPLLGVERKPATNSQLSMLF